MNAHGASKGAVLLFARAAGANEAKSRLGAALGAEKARSLYRAFLLDTLSLLAAYPGPRLWAVHPDPDAETRALAEQRGIETYLQRGASFGERFTAAISEALARPYSRIVLIGADSPTLPPYYLAAAQHLLESFDLAVGPSYDGGFYLLGVRGGLPLGELLGGLSWSTPLVCGELAAAAARMDRRVAWLPSWYDLDLPADLELAARHACGLERATHTRAALTSRS